MALPGIPGRDVEVKVVAKIIKLDTSKKKTEPAVPETGGCEHKNVRVSEAYRTVHCVYCGALLDPFDVLVDMVKGYIPPDRTNHEEMRLLKEVAKRKKKTGAGNRHHK